ncbi:hypothetical protein EDD22DRAFT_952010 [Suillus occidentalis]|nr:hypothetical protein EDD22DRAFT_952010 [Suillus occidentalis]
MTQVCSILRCSAVITNQEGQEAAVFHDKTVCPKCYGKPICAKCDRLLHAQIPTISVTRIVPYKYEGPDYGTGIIHTYLPKPKPGYAIRREEFFDGDGNMHYDLNLISTSSRTSRSSLSSAPAPYDELLLKQLTDVNTFRGHQEPPLDARINSLTSSPFTNFAQEFKRKHKKVLSFVYGLLASMPSVPFRQQPRLPSRLTPRPSKKARTTIPTALAVLSA